MNTALPQMGSKTQFGRFFV